MKERKLKIDLCNRAKNHTSMNIDTAIGKGDYESNVLDVFMMLIDNKFDFFLHTNNIHRRFSISIHHLLFFKVLSFQHRHKAYQFDEIRLVFERNLMTSKDLFTTLPLFYFRQQYLLSFIK